MFKQADAGQVPGNLRIRILAGVAVLVLLACGGGLAWHFRSRFAPLDGKADNNARSFEARVDDSPIFGADLYRTLIMNDGPKALHQLVEQKLIFAEAARQKLTLDDKDSAAQLNDLTQRYKNPNVLAVLEPQLRCRLLLRKLVTKEVPDAYFHHLYDVFHPILSQYAVDGLIVLTPDDAEQVRAALLRGDSVESLVTRYGADTIRIQAQRYDELQTSLSIAAADAVIHLKPGQIAGPLQVSTGFAVLRLARVVSDYWGLKPSIEDLVAQGRRMAMLHRLAAQANLQMPWWDHAISQHSGEIYTSDVFAPASVKQSGKGKTSVFAAPSFVPTHDKGGGVFAPAGSTSPDAAASGNVFAPPIGAPSDKGGNVFAPPSSSPGR